MVNIKEVIIGSGIGKIRFGMTKKEVQNLAGKPDETELLPGLEEDPGDDLEVWHYDEHEFSLVFDADYDWRLVSISVSDPYFHFFGQSVVGMRREDALKFLADQNIETSSFEDVSDEDSSDLQKLESDESGLIVWFEDGFVTELQIFPDVEDDGETYKWPE
jgi:hypothetical protein